MVQFRSEESFGHAHTISISCDDPQGARTLESTLDLFHTHELRLEPEEVRTLLDHGTLRIESAAGGNPPSDHTHQWTLSIE